MTDPREPESPEPGKRGVTEDLASRIARAKRERASGANAEAGASGARDMSGMGRALRLGSEFIAAILVGLGVGYLLDRWLGTTPWLMLVMLLVGFAAGVLNVTRSVGELNKAAPPPPGSDLGPDDEEDE